MPDGPRGTSSETSSAVRRTFPVNAARLQLHALDYNIANVMQTLALPKAVEHWSLTNLREKRVKIGAKIVTHAQYVTFEMAEVTVPRNLFREILQLIDGLRRLPPAPACEVATEITVREVCPDEEKSAPIGRTGAFTPNSGAERGQSWRHSPFRI